MPVRVRGKDRVLVALASAHHQRTFELARLVVATRHAALVASLRAEVDGEEVRRRAGARVLGDGDDTPDRHAEPLQVFGQRHTASSTTSLPVDEAPAVAGASNGTRQ